MTMFKTNYNSLPDPGYQYPENNYSQTVPEMSMSINEIISRSLKGLPVPQTFKPVYNGDVEVADPSQMDLRDLELMRDHLSATVSDIETAKAKIEDEKRLQKENQEKQRWFDEETKKRTNPTPLPGDLPAS